MPIAPILISSDQESSSGIREGGPSPLNEDNNYSPSNFDNLDNVSASLQGDEGEPDVEKGTSEVS